MAFAEARALGVDFLIHYGMRPQKLKGGAGLLPQMSSGQFKDGTGVVLDKLWIFMGDLQYRCGCI